MLSTIVLIGDYKVYQYDLGVCPTSGYGLGVWQSEHK